MFHRSAHIPSESSQFTRVLPKCVDTDEHSHGHDHDNDHQPYPISPLYSSAEIKHKIQVFSQDSKLWQNKIHEYLKILDESVSFVGSDLGNSENVEFNEITRQIRQHLQKVLFNLSEAEKISKKVGDQEQDVANK